VDARGRCRGLADERSTGVKRILATVLFMVVVPSLVGCSYYGQSWTLSLDGPAWERPLPYDPDLTEAVESVLARVATDYGLRYDGVERNDWYPIYGVSIFRKNKGGNRSKEYSRLSGSYNEIVMYYDRIARVIQIRDLGKHMGSSSPPRPFAASLQETLIAELRKKVDLSAIEISVENFPMSPLR
jgi:hypothetical protein